MIWWILAFPFVSLILWMVFRSLSISQLASHSQPVTNFGEAIAQIKALQEKDNQDLVRDLCISKLYDHGNSTEHVILLIHGFTNCPEQFNELGKQYYQAGYNVFIPRMP